MTDTSDPQREAAPQLVGADEPVLLLHERDAREQVFDAYPDGVLVLDAKGAVVDMNRAASELLGRGRDARVPVHEVLVEFGEERAPDAVSGVWRGRVQIRRPDGETLGVSARCVVVPDEHETLRLLVLSDRPTDAERAAWDETQRVEERIGRLQSITDAALVHLSLDQLFEQLLGRLRDLLGADSVTVLLLDPQARVLRIRATSGLERPPEEVLDVPIGAGVAGRIAAERRPLVIGDLARVPAVSPFLGHTLRSLVGVPILHQDEVRGVLHAGSSRPRRFTGEDVSLLELVAARLAPAIENARLLEAEREARREEERAREQLQTLAEAGAAMAESLDPRRMLGALVRTTTKRLADYSCAYLVDRGGAIVDVVTAHRDPALDAILHRAATMRFPDPDDPVSLIARVLRTGRPAMEPEISPAFLEGVTIADEQRELGGRLRPASVVAVPLAAHGRLLGILGLVRTEDSARFAKEDLDLATELGRRAGSLLDNARLHLERESIADTLERSLLPPDLPDVPGLEVGARYRAAAPGTTVGGDFYDVFEIDPDNWGVLIGDVVGKGAQAAAMMGLARYTIRTAAMAETRPSALLRTLNEAILRQMRDAMFTTACFARVRRDGAGARATLAIGGHPLPFVVRASGEVETTGEPGTLLGVFEDPSLTDRVLDLRPGDALVLYTDGVTDERRGDEEFGEGRLRRLLATLAGATAEHIADAIERAVVRFRTGDPKDDVAVLVLRVPS